MVKVFEIRKIMNLSAPTSNDGASMPSQKVDPETCPFLKSQGPGSAFRNMGCLETTHT